MKKVCKALYLLLSVICFLSSTIYSQNAINKNMIVSNVPYLKINLDDIKYNDNNKDQNKTKNGVAGIGSEKSIYWKVTEDGLIYCPVHCILTTDEFYKKYEELIKTYMNIYEKQEKEIETALVLNITNSIIKANENKFKITAIETTSTFEPKSQPKIKQDSLSSVTSWIDTTSTDIIQPQAILECIPYVNSTEFDDLTSIVERFNLPNKPEPELLSSFHKYNNLDQLKAKLIKMKNEKPYSPNVYVKIANFFRIKGNSFQAIECFRKAISLDPFNSDTLMSAARFLYNLEYYDDSIEFTRKSIDYIKPGQVPYEQHYTLAQILIAYGNEHQASLHLQYALKLKPNYKDAQLLLDEVDEILTKSVFSKFMKILGISLFICAVLFGLFLIFASINQNNSQTKNKEENKNDLVKDNNNNNNNNNSTNKIRNNSNNSNDSDLERISINQNQNHNNLNKRRNTISNSSHLKHGKPKRS